MMNKFTMAALAVALTSSMGAMALTSKGEFDINFTQVDQIVINTPDDINLSADTPVSFARFCVGAVGASSEAAVSFSMVADSANGQQLVASSDTAGIPYVLKYSMDEAASALPTVNYNSAKEIAFNQVVSGASTGLTRTNCEDDGRFNGLFWADVSGSELSGFSADLYSDTVTMLVTAE